MKTINTIFGGFTGNSLTAMALMDKVRNKMTWKDDLFCVSIKTAKQPDIKTIRDMQDFITDNKAMVEKIIGPELVNEIINFK